MQEKEGEGKTGRLSCDRRNDFEMITFQLDQMLHTLPISICQIITENKLTLYGKCCVYICLCVQHEITQRNPFISRWLQCLK